MPLEYLIVVEVLENLMVVAEVLEKLLVVV